MLVAAAVFATSTSFPLLLLAATVGVLSPSGQRGGAVPGGGAGRPLAAGGGRDGGPRTFAWYQLTGSLATAAGSLCGGGLVAGAGAGRPLPAGQLPRGLARLRAGRTAPGGPLPAPLAGGGGGASGRRPRRRGGAGAGLAGAPPLARGRAGGSPPCSPSTPSPAASWCRATWPTGSSARFGADPATLGGHLLRGQRAGRPLGALGRRHRPPHRPGEHHGGDAPALQRAAGAGAAHAQPAAGGGGALPPLLHLADGRPHAPVLHHGGGRARRALGGRRGDRDGADGGRGPGSAAGRAALRQSLRWRASRSCSRAGSRCSTTCCSGGAFRAVRPPEERARG